MKHKIKVWMVALMCMLTSGCSTVPQPTMEELMAEVNAEHASIQKPDVSSEQYSQYVSFRSSMNQDLKPAKSEGNSELSLEQAEFDINLLFDGFGIKPMGCMTFMAETRSLKQRVSRHLQIVKMHAK